MAGVPKMHVEIHYKIHEDGWGCFCEQNNPKYFVKIVGYPEDIEAPLAFFCCDNCIEYALKQYEPMLLAYEKFKVNCNEALSDMFEEKRKFIEKFMKAENASN